MSWAVHQKTDPPAPKTDFKKLNKVVVKEGLSKAKDYGDYKKNHQVVQNLNNRANQKKENKVPIDENFIFGKKERASTPIGQVLSNQYAIECEKILAENYKKQEEEKKKKNLSDVKINKTQILALKNKEKIDGKQKDAEKKQPFVLKKFQNISSKIDNNKKAVLKNKEEEIIENYFDQNIAE